MTEASVLVSLLLVTALSKETDLCSEFHFLCNQRHIDTSHYHLDHGIWEKKKNEI